MARSAVLADRAKDQIGYSDRQMPCGVVGSLLFTVELTSQKMIKKSGTIHSATLHPAKGLPSDELLVSETLGGNRDAYRALVEKYQGKIQAMAFDILKNREDAEDICQESFVKAFLSLSKFKGESSFYTWLYRIAFNMAIDLRRKAGRRGGAHIEFREGNSVSSSTGAVQENGGAATQVPEHLQNVEGPHEALHRKESGAVLNEVFNTLSPEHRAVVELREVDGLNYEEISEAIGVPRGTVMSRLHYARKMLQKALAEFAPLRNDTKEVTDPPIGAFDQNDVGLKDKPASHLDAVSTR